MYSGRRCNYYCGCSIPVVVLMHWLKHVQSESLVGEEDDLLSADVFVYLEIYNQVQNALCHHE